MKSPIDYINLEKIIKRHYKNSNLKIKFKTRNKCVVVKTNWQLCLVKKDNMIVAIVYANEIEGGILKTTKVCDEKITNLKRLFELLSEDAKEVDKMDDKAKVVYKLEGKKNIWRSWKRVKKKKGGTSGNAYLTAMKQWLHIDYKYKKEVKKNGYETKRI